MCVSLDCIRPCIESEFAVCVRGASCLYCFKDICHDVCLLIMCRLTADLLLQGFVRLFLGDLTTSWATPKCFSKMPTIYFWSRNGIVYLLVKFSSCSVLYVDGFTGEGTKAICHVYLQQFNSIQFNSLSRKRPHT